jgi:hypothetical protein
LFCNWARRRYGGDPSHCSPIRRGHTQAHPAKGRRSKRPGKNQDKYIKRRSAATLEQAGKMIESCKEALDKRKTQLVGVVEAGKDAYQVATSKLASAL